MTDLEMDILAEKIAIKLHALNNSVMDSEYAMTMSREDRRKWKREQMLAENREKKNILK